MEKQQVDNIIFLRGKLGTRVGGPSGYLNNLKSGIEKYTEAKNIIFVTQEGEEKKTTLLDKIKRKLKGQNGTYHKLNALDYAEYIPILDKYDFKTIICHSVVDSLFIKEYLSSRKLGAKLMLMSHSPEPPSLERYHHEIIKSKYKAKRNLKIWSNVERKAFEACDIMVFPSKEAMEPYTSVLDYFEDLAAKKDVRFVPTGCNEIDINASTEDIRAKYNIKTKYIIAYIGRHTKIKGYDALKEIAQKVLAKRDDVTFVIGGPQGIAFEPLEHERWIELGRINPADLLKVADLFILPNKQTYFDLVLLEVLSSGVPVIASNTGGNKSVHMTTGAIELYDSQEEATNKIEEYLNSTEEEKQRKKSITRAAYENNYTVMHFAQNYVNLIENIVKEEQKCEKI